MTSCHIPLEMHELWRIFAVIFFYFGIAMLVVSERSWTHDLLIYHLIPYVHSSNQPIYLITLKAVKSKIIVDVVLGIAYWCLIIYLG
jgi:hypothetical protein